MSYESSLFGGKGILIFFYRRFESSSTHSRRLVKPVWLRSLAEIWPNLSPCNEERPCSAAPEKKGCETTTGCFHRRILAVQLPPCLWENWRWLVRPVPLVVATFLSVLVWLLGNIGKVMSCFIFFVLFGGMYCMFQTVCITVIYLFLQIFAANQDCIQQVPHECRAFSLRQSNDSYAHVDDHTVVVGALYCRTFPLPNHGKS